MDSNLPSNLNLPSLTQDQRAIYYAEALRDEIASKPGEDSSAIRRRLQAQYGVFKGATAAQAERLLQEYPELVAVIKDGSQKLPKLPDEWAALKKKATPKPNPEPETSATPTPTPEAAAAPTTPKSLLIPFDSPGGPPLEPHPLAAPFPLIEGEEFAELVADLRKNGLLHHIVVYQDKILDGRNRERGCTEAEVTKRYLEYIGDDPLGFVISANLRRRHLTLGQRAAIAEKLSTTTLGGDRTPREQSSNSNSAPAEQKPTPADATLKGVAKKMKVSRTSAALARKIAEASPEIAARVQSGELTLNKAAEMAGLSRGYAKPSKPSKLSKPTKLAPAKINSVPADPRLDETLIAKCEEFLQTLRLHFPSFNLEEIVLAWGAAVTRMRTKEESDESLSSSTSENTP